MAGARTYIRLHTTFAWGVQGMQPDLHADTDWHGKRFPVSIDDFKVHVAVVDAAHITGIHQKSILYDGTALLHCLCFSQFHQLVFALLCANAMQLNRLYVCGMYNPLCHIINACTHAHTKPISRLTS